MRKFFAETNFVPAKFFFTARLWKITIYHLKSLNFVHHVDPIPPNRRPVRVSPVLRSLLILTASTFSWSSRLKTQYI